MTTCDRNLREKDISLYIYIYILQAAHLMQLQDVLFLVQEARASNRWLWSTLHADAWVQLFMYVRDNIYIHTYIHIHTTTYLYSTSPNRGF